MIVLSDTQIGDIRLIIDLDEDVCIISANQPLRYIVAATDRKSFCLGFPDPLNCDKRTRDGSALGRFPTLWRCWKQPSRNPASAAPTERLSHVDAGFRIVASDGVSASSS
jgi:hypothetical protein